jgi:exosortase
MVASLEEKKESNRGVETTTGVPPWRIAQWSLMVAAFLYLYVPVLTKLVANWWDDSDYSHGFLVPVLGAYFAWQRRHRLAEVPPQPSWWGGGVLLLGLSMLLLGNIGAELFLMRSSMIVVLAGLILYHLGWRHLQTLAFPLAFLLFMIPLPAILLNAITFPLQLLAAKMSTFALQAISLPVYREGNVIFLPRTTLEIVEACSGIRSLVSLLALAVVFAYMTQHRLWKRMMLVVSAVPIALVANAFRIWGTGVLAHFYGTRVAEGFYHTFAGWLIFLVAFGLLALVGLMLSQCTHQGRAKERTQR